MRPQYHLLAIVPPGDPGGLLVTQGTFKVGYIARCQDAITTVDLGIQTLSLDQEFYVRKVIDFLTTVQVLLITPVRKYS